MAAHGSADKTSGVLRSDAGCGQMRIGDNVTYDGRLWVVRGLDPMGVPDRRADLEDAETGERIRVAVALLGPAGDRPEEGWLH